MTGRDDEIEDIRKAEMRRGSRRRPVDSKTLKERSSVKNKVAEIFQSGTIEELKDLMLKAGLRPGSPEWTEVLRVWHDSQ